MTSNIRLNYEKVMREAARLDGEENVFEEQVKKICGVAERLRHEWESPASAVCIQKIEQIAKYVGVAFQIQDDILDVTSTVEVLGKPIHSDEKNEKTTYVTLLGIENAKEAVESLSMEAIHLLHSISGENQFLEMLLKELIYREK